MATYQLRNATEQDFGFLYALHEQTMKFYVEQTWGWDDADQLARFRGSFAPGKHQIIVCDGEDVGAVAVERSERGPFISSLEVIPKWQRRGIGTQVILDIVNDAGARGLSTRLQVLKVNPARRLYERLGFTLIGETETHWAMEFRDDRVKR